METSCADTTSRFPGREMGCLLGTLGNARGRCCFAGEDRNGSRGTMVTRLLNFKAKMLTGEMDGASARHPTAVPRSPARRHLPAQHDRESLHARANRLRWEFNWKPPGFEIMHKVAQIGGIDPRHLIFVVTTLCDFVPSVIFS